MIFSKTRRRLPNTMWLSQERALRGKTKVESAENKVLVMSASPRVKINIDKRVFIRRDYKGKDLKF
jgi:hypothetical protein